MELTEAIVKRRSIRKFTDYYVKDEELTEMIDAARWAPSWAHTQVTEFIIVRDKNIIEKVVGTYSPKNPATKCSLAASALLVACAKKKKSGHYNEIPATKYGDWLMFDVGMAVQNLCLRAHELGLGTVVVGMINHDACANVLSVPQDFEVLVVVPVGKPEVAGKEGPPRKDISTMMHLDRFGNPFRK